MVTKCGIDGCNKIIHRNEKHVCYNCGVYCCEDHLVNYYDPSDNPVYFENQNGKSNQVCEDCADRLEEGRV
jgi:hypothetical protein